MNEHQSITGGDSELRRPTLQERAEICRRWSKIIRKEIKRNKISAEMHICLVLLLLLVLIVQLPHNPFLFVAVGAVMAVCLVRTFSGLVRASRKLKKRQMLLEEGRFRVAKAEGKRMIPNRGRHPFIGVEVERVSASVGGEYRSILALKKGEDVSSYSQFPVLLVQLEGESEVVVFPLLYGKWE